MRTHRPRHQDDEHARPPAHRTPRTGSRYSGVLPGLPHHKAGNAAVVQMLRRSRDGTDTPAPPRPTPTTVQRTIYDFDAATDPFPLTTAQVTQQRWFQELHPDHQRRVMALSEGDGFYDKDSALDETRNTVVAAASGQQPSEIDFVASAHGLRDHVSAYDPEMSTSTLGHLLEAAHVDPGTTRLHRESVTRFGTQVPHTEILVPHPGPWLYKTGDGDLADCLHTVLGHSSTAHVLTDNEPHLSMATILEGRIEELNDEKIARDPGYQPLEVRSTHLDVPEGSTTDKLGGARLRISHSPTYYLVTVTRR